MSGKKILIVDDDARNIFALKATLLSKNYDCLSAQSALTALEMLEHQNDIGIVLLDMMMPEMDGYEALAKIRSNPKIKGTPVISITAQAMVGDREKCMEAGADNYISKPVDVDKLLTVLNQYLK